MAAPDFPIVGTYKTYKKRTQRITEYLVDSAKKIGFRSKRTIATNCDLGDIKASEYVEYAEAIKRQPNLKVPGWLVPEIEETVRLRRRVARFYDATTAKKTIFKTAAEDAQDSTQRHAYFISVLERVLEVFRPQLIMGDNNVESGDTKLDDTQVDAIVNRFEVLSMHEDTMNENAESAMANGSGVTHGASYDTPDPLRDCLDDMDDGFDIQLASYCLFEDLHSIKLYVKSLWEEYRTKAKDGLDLVTVSLVTNTAIDLVKRLDEEFRQAAPNCTSYMDIVSGALFKVAMQRLNEKVVSSEGVHNSKGSVALALENCEDAEESADWLMYPTYLTLKKFMRTMDWKMFSFRRGTPPAEINTERSAMTTQEKRDRDRQVLLSVLPDIRFAAMFCCTGAPTEQSSFDFEGYKRHYNDEINKGMAEYLETGVIQLWFVFALQTFVDIYNIMGESMSTPFDELYETALAAKATLEVCVRDGPKHATYQGVVTGDYSQAKKVLKSIQNWELCDPTHGFLTDFAADERTEDESHLMVPFYLHKRHPLMCGTRKFMLSMVVRDVAFLLPIQGACIVSAMHLYNCLYQSGELSSWNDMEMFIDIHQHTGIFLGERPKSRQSCLNVYRRAIESMIRCGDYYNDNLTPLLDSIRLHYFDRSEVRIGINRIELVVRALRPRASKRSRERFATDGDSAVVLLRDLMDQLRSESPKHNFGYISLYLRCRKILVAAGEATRERVIAFERYRSGISPSLCVKLKDEENLARTVLRILDVTVAKEKLAKNTYKLLAPRLLEDKYLDILRLAAGAMQRIIQEN